MHDGAQFLEERTQLVYLPSALDLVGEKNVQLRASWSPVIVAEPDYGGKNLERAAGDGRRVLVPVDPLEGTGREADAISRMFTDPTILRGTKAAEEEVVKLQGPPVLHLATHGFFASSQAAAGGRALKLVGPSGAKASAGIGGSPLLWSGLVLAGAAAKSRRPVTIEPKRSRDGVLTALEVADMDLEGTALVVLSACETARGKVDEEQGVFGLVRGFQMAGARNVIASLWSIDDDTTERLMVEFYRRLKSGEKPAVALRAAALQLRSSRPEPYFWAPFIAVGPGQ